MNFNNETNIDNLAYLLFMENEEKKHDKTTVKKNNNLECGLPTTREIDKENCDFPLI